LSKISDIELFEYLKKDITKRFFESNSASSRTISDWKGQDIVTFQEDVFNKTKSTVSEKWFYTYFKSDFKKLPRIDMLNLLAQYAGYSGWAEFLLKFEDEEEEINPIPKNVDQNSNIEARTDARIEDSREFEVENKDKQENIQPNTQEKIRYQTESKKKSNGLWIGIIAVLVLLLVGGAVYFGVIYTKTYEFCFIDADRNTFIKEPIEITVARKGSTPLELLTQNGCVEFSSTEDTLLLTVNSTYYKKDTFKINLHQYQGKENIRLEPDDYKVMLRHYSKSSQSVKERIKMLDQMISDDALIYQVYDNEYFGVEVLNKKQYINLVSLPTTSLKNFTLIEAERKSGKIVKIKFKIHSDEN
jgi:flagellar basal body-associated protein FliL